MAANNGQLSQEVIDEVAAYAKTMNNQEYAQELYVKMDKVGKLLKGKPAIDFSFTYMEGNAYRLSDFKGNNISHLPIRTLIRGTRH